MPTKHGKRRTKVIGAEFGAFSLVDEIVDDYDELVKMLLREKNWGDKFSEKYIRKELQTIIAKIIKSAEQQKDTNDLLEKFINSLVNYNKEWIVLVPLSGLVMKLNSVQLGKVTIYTITKEKAEKFFVNIDVIVKSMKYTEEEKQQIIQSLREYSKNTQNNICAEFRVIAEPDRALERAEEETLRVLDIIRYSIPSLYHDDQRVKVSLMGEITTIVKCSPMISSDSKSFTLNNQVIGPLIPFELSDNSMKQMEKIGAIKLLAILTKPKEQVSEFERILLRSVHWYSSSLTQYEIENQFLNLITCLETFLTPRDGNPIGTAIAEGVVILITTGVENRIALKKEIQKLYGLRSAVSHGGKKEILESDVKELNKIVRRLIMNMIRRIDEFKSQKELLSWIEEQKLS
ncbi:MAG: hypothetical protein HS127_20230 [Planctomycetia bacterium]|uniref:hypothetical protein n=1 Tax=Candidatus Kuenenia sp. TaxID=2499824 RepID=UPI001E028F0F|nr:hypothetical protein [Planctomycetia bacterium]